MNRKSVEKLQKAGYVFLRSRDCAAYYAIMQSKVFGSWTLLEKFATKAARRRRLAELIEQPDMLIEFDEAETGE
jgi:hypothetical protein